MILLCSVAAGVLSMLAFTLSAENYVGVSDLPLTAFSAVWLLYAVVLAGLWFLFLRSVGLPARLRRRTQKSELTDAEKQNGQRRRVSPGMIAVGLAFGIVNYFATTLFAYDTWSFLDSVWAWGKAILCILGQAAVMTAAASLLCGWLETPSGGKPMRRFPRLMTWMRGHPIGFSMAVMVICWLPYLIVFYPGTVIWDMAEMLGMQLGLREMTNWHPVFVTWVFTGLVQLGRVFGSDNIGVFAYALLQTALLSYALARAIDLLRRFGISEKLRVAALLFFALSPICPSFAQAVGKDTMYAALALLFAVQMMEWLRFGRPKPWRLAAMGITALLLCLTRNNGVYLVVPAAIGLLLAVKGLKDKGLVTGVLGIALAVYFAFSGLLLPAMGITDATASGIYSVAFQQSARTLRDEIVSEEDYTEIDLVLDADNIAALYETNISDPVKYTFKQYGLGSETETAALTRYRRTWLTMLSEYPLTYLEAFVAGNTGYYAFTPKIDAAQTYNNQGGVRFVFETVAAGEDALDLHTTQIAAFATAREWLAIFARGWRRLPILELVLFCALYTWLIVIAALSVIRQRRRRELAAFLPALMSLAVCLLSPVNDYFRYFLPVVLMTIPLLGLAKRTK